MTENGSTQRGATRWRPGGSTSGVSRATPDGAWRHVRTAFQGNRLLASGQWQVIGLTQDVTDLVKARDAAQLGEQAALAASAAKSQFLANMSHELRTPMNGVLGILHLLKREPSPSERQRLIDEALATGVGLSDLLNDIIDYSDVEAGRVELATEPLDPAAELESVMALLRPRAEAKGLKVNLVAPELGWVSGDRARLRKVFFHLIGNAVKFTPEGQVDIKLAADGDGDARRLKLVVADSGIGISPENQTTLFRAVQPARRLLDASVWRAWAWPGHHPQARQDDGRRCALH